MIPGFEQVDWNKIFLPDTPLLEIFVRGTVTYLGMFCMFRLILRRQAGTLGMNDMLVVVMIADAAQNGMAGEYQSLPNGLLLVGTIMFWDYALDWLGYRFPALQRLLHAPPVTLIRNGKLMRHNMRTQLISTGELDSVLRENGVNDISEVRRACMEGDGQISVQKFEDNDPPKKKREAS